MSKEFLLDLLLTVYTNANQPLPQARKLLCNEVSQGTVNRLHLLLRVGVRTNICAYDCQYHALEYLTKKKLPLYYDTAVHSGKGTEPCTHTDVGRVAVNNN
jgi:hypothetical protein